MDVVKSQQTSSRPIEKVVVHPLVLLSIVDNFYRVAKDTSKRVVGVLLGSSFRGIVDVTNSYAGLYFVFLATCFGSCFRVSLLGFKRFWLGLVSEEMLEWLCSV